MPKLISPSSVPAPYTRALTKEGALTPEIIDPRITDVEALARWLDYAFALPGGFRFGVAGIIGLIPGIGDIFDALVSLYIVIRAINVGVSRVTIARMLVNVSIEAIAGSVPLIGDLFDIAFKANRRNYQLLKSHMAAPEHRHAQDKLFLFFTVVVVIAAIALPILLLSELVKHI